LLAVAGDFGELAGWRSTTIGDGLVGHARPHRMAALLSALATIVGIASTSMLRRLEWTSMPGRCFDFPFSISTPYFQDAKTHTPRYARELLAAID
jgi:hypothetical protein